MAKPTVAERCIAALKRHGPCTLEQLAKHVGSTVQSLHTITSQLRARGVQKAKAGNRPAVYSLDLLQAGADLGKRTTQERGTERQLRAAVGNGSAETPGPALFSGAIEALEAQRAKLLAQVEKLDRAIEAVRALA